MNRVNPPKYPLRFFRWFCHPDYVEDIEGDLLERFEKRQSRLFFTLDVLRLFRPGIIKDFEGSQKLNYYGMLKYNLKVALRGFFRFKASFLINLIGLSSGLLCVFLIYLWVNSEMTIDKFHANDERLYQVKQNINIINKVETIDAAPALLSKVLKEELPGVENATAIIPHGTYGTGGIVQFEDKRLKVMDQFATETFFEVFSFPLKKGLPHQVLADKQNVVLSEDLAIKLFGKEVDPIGKQIVWEKRGKTKTYFVSGVFENVPANSTLQFNLVFSLENFLDRYPHIRDWGNSDPRTFIVLDENADAAVINNKINKLIKQKWEGYRHSFLVQKFSEIYLYGTYENGLPQKGRMQYVEIFSIIAAFILLIACINFMNLSTARASRRLKEIGVKKSMGVSRFSIGIQFVFEAFLLSLFSLIVALTVVQFFLPVFNRIVDKNLTLHVDLQFLSVCGIVLLAVTLLAGSYPALYLSGFKPIQILKGKMTNSLSDLWIRKGLVIFQFCATSLLISSVLVITSQIDYIMNKNLGYDKEQVIYFNTDGNIDENSSTFIHELKKIPGVENAALFGHDLLGDKGMTTGLSWEGKDPEAKIRFANLEIGYDLIETFGMEMVQGRSYSNAFGDESAKIILNEKAIEVMGLEDPIGKTIKIWRRDREIIGVVKNFHLESLHDEILPCFMQYYPELSSVIIRIHPQNQLETIAQIEELYLQFNPELGFNFRFFDQEYEALYKSEMQMSNLSQSFAIIAIIISCLGLFGLVTFTAEKRQKEIGIRKVLGASVRQLMVLLSADFMKLIFISILISAPVSYFLVRSWISSFVYRIDLNISYFLAAGLLSIAIALLTISTQTIKTAAANPVDSLKDQ
ncbi:MAG: ABC transporter permease [Ekhidna sp.]